MKSTNSKPELPIELYASIYFDNLSILNYHKNFWHNVDQITMKFQIKKTNWKENKSFWQRSLQRSSFNN